MAKSFYAKFTQKSNAAIKEGHKQAKRVAKKEREAAINKRFEEKRAWKAAQLAAQAAAGETPVRGKKGKFASLPPAPAPVIQQSLTGEQMPLNKFLAHCGVASRREAADLIRDGKATVDGVVITDPAFKVQGTEKILYLGKQVRSVKNLVYILLNKPKDYLTTTDDPQGRKTVLQLIRSATTERVYPIGRLDRNTSGVLLLTNDGDLTQQLSHPSYQISKVYEAKLDKPLTKADFDAILSGITLEDGPIHADSLAYADAQDKSVIGIEIHSGKNRIVRRIFEHLGYDVKGLDRVLYAGLTKKNVERGKWRFLTEKEIRLLKFMNSGKGKKKNVVKGSAEADAPQATPAPKRASSSRPTSTKQSTALSGGTRKPSTAPTDTRWNKPNNRDRSTDKPTGGWEDKRAARSTATKRKPASPSRTTGSNDKAKTFRSSERPASGGAGQWEDKRSARSTTPSRKPASASRGMASSDKPKTYRSSEKPAAGGIRQWEEKKRSSGPTPTTRSAKPTERKSTPSRAPRKLK